MQFLVGIYLDKLNGQAYSLSTIFFSSQNSLQCVTIWKCGILDGNENLWKNIMIKVSLQWKWNDIYHENLQYKLFSLSPISTENQEPLE